MCQTLHRHIISDSGNGIPPENIAKIFDPFFTTKDIGEGTGLGLWMSYGIIKSFNGNIFVDSIENRGASFEIIIPITTDIVQSRNAADTNHNMDPTASHG